ncbi:uncharacterized protein LOC100829447 [Brachypodium distachyon]|uniref:WIYLD domain-containing protein n=1 Tax=Brachypodium distachyon TaxID=15368 RepID=A0A2K2CGD1_BRADI|nr:uncharacterized protein LOC100829447 [Brachypodium distachyon]PNT61088.1 hypothetical protein BRADI_5g10220v3 [Brachypodium distachyon]PNT61091.1 hypothetical protein BRADI_5g10220v3 [Brachypodium distachyon]|eukprot:XP_024312140.1 uncharacterized protein LOC100829447 [Brachypodium distachyon]
MSRRRSRVGRMDAAIDHFTPMGYKETQVRSVVNSLLKVYGNDGWPLLEGDCYEVVQQELFKQEEEEEKLQLQEQKQQPVEDVEEEGGSSTTRSSNAILRVHTDVPSEAVLTVDEKEEVVPMIIDAPALRDMLPHPLPAVIGRTRRP